MRVHDIILGPAVVLAGAGLCVWATALPQPQGFAYGPNLFPTLTGSGLALAGLSILFAGIKKRRMGPLFERPDWSKRWRLAINFWLIPVAIIAYVLLVEPLGFLITATLLLFALMIANRVHPRRAAVVALIIALAINLLFASILHVPLPWGPLTAVSGWLIW
ncbi:tripartite tricarboxylate transporter TctB family protein [Salinicola lusitanus]|uniref:tripartite tricarboxylate transporter TctB family protein n=1 Tax=Salinicola lusitanus TaxID=1949085 RepID=UPI000DA250AA|nr:tripartite tricarboxylate transporter TctB family protein [Salinicola lusitanus]